MDILGFIPVLIWLAIWLWALVDAGGRPAQVWRQAGESKTMWMLLILVLQFFGTLLYLWRVRRRLIAIGP
jgi:hypothetical protein